MVTYSNTDELIAEALRCLEICLAHSSFIASPEDARHYCILQLRAELNEVFSVLFLNGAHAVIAFEKMFRGSIDMTTVHPRVVAQRALALNASSVILAHNHPSGVAEPSSADKHITHILKTSLALFEIKVLDHLVVGLDSCVSFAERGLL